MVKDNMNYNKKCNICSTYEKICVECYCKKYKPKIYKELQKNN